MKNSILSSWVQMLSDACGPQEVKQIAAQIARFHRIQGTSGFHAAAECAVAILRDAGLHSEILSYPADRKNTYFSQVMPRQWECRSAWLELTGPRHERAADFCLEEMSLIQRSVPADYSGKDVPIVYIPDSAVPQETHADVKGKLLFVENGFERWLDFCMENQAVGILTVSMPEIAPVRLRPWEDPQMQDSHANLSFHHYTEDSEQKLRGFALSPRCGHLLKKECIALAGENRFPTAKFCIDSSFQDGQIENVTAVIEGSTDQEVLLTAHLCHPRSSVNDNASGAACAIEAMRTLQRLIDSGELSKPRCSIRLLLLPEFTGTYAWLWENRHRLNRVVAGFNMDLVAGRMDGRAGPLVIVDTPDCAHSFAGDLSETILGQMQKECAFGGADRYVPMLFALRVPFALGSDHYILSDPTIGIPTVALTQWPDKTYHTSADDLTHLDPWLMKKDVTWAAVYCLAYANFSFQIMQQVLPCTERRLFERVNSIRMDGTLTPEERSAYNRYLGELIDETLKNYVMLLPSAERPAGETLAEQEMHYMQSLLPEDTEAQSEVCKQPKPCPKRLFRAPLAMRCVQAAMTREQREQFQQIEQAHRGCTTVMDQIIYEMNGKRTVSEIAQRVFFQSGVHCEAYAAALTEFLIQLGLVSLENLS